MAGPKDKLLKGSEVFERSEFIMGRKAPWREVFPSIDQIRIEVTERGRGVSEGGIMVFDTYREYVDCHNPLCYGGGVRISLMLPDMVRNRRVDHEESRRCDGYEGSPKTRKFRKPCFNHFTVKIHLTYKPEQPK